MYDCYSCKRPIVAPSTVASYDNNYYHPDCLVCTVCKRSVSGKQFLKEKSGNLVCEECHAKTAPRCITCRLVFAPGESYKKLEDSIFYHNECFKCCGPCRKPIAAEFYDMEGGKFLCIDCYDKYGLDYETANPNDDVYNPPPPPVPTSVPQRSGNNYSPYNNEANKLASDLNANLTFGSRAPPAPAPAPAAASKPSRFNADPNAEVLPAVQRDRFNAPPPSSSNRPAPQPTQPADSICGKCNQKINGTYTVYAEKKYHPKCFVCCQCNQEFKEKTFFKLNGNPLCRDCNNRNQVESATKCRKCAQPILETVVTFKGGEYHDYCLVCTMCSNKLIGQSIYNDKQENPFCVDCFTKKEAKVCAKCHRSIPPNVTNLVFEDKNFHKECFTCRDCRRPINSSESFYKADDGESLICDRCINK